jgi:hypothetical protein
VCRKCGKPNCACAQPGHRGHGPELEKAKREVAEQQRFAALGVLEQAMRAALTSAAARLLQAVLAGEDGYCGPAGLVPGRPPGHCTDVQMPGYAPDLNPAGHLVAAQAVHRQLRRG